jgi:hypothetical protein
MGQGQIRLAALHFSGMAVVLNAVPIKNLNKQIN